MDAFITPEQLTSFGLNQQTADVLAADINAQVASNATTEGAWETISRQILAGKYSFPIQQFIFNLLFPSRYEYPESAPVCIPTIEQIASANITHFMAKHDMQNAREFHAWTVKHYRDFWAEMAKQLQIIFKKPAEDICELSNGIQSPSWFKGAKLNIIDSCFTAPKTAPAIIYYDANKNLRQLSYDELNNLSNSIANSLIHHGYQAGDAIAIVMPMTFQAIAIYLGIIKMGGVVVSIADSFSSEEMATRLQIANAKLAFTQDYIQWGEKQLPLYEKIAATNIKSVVIPHSTILTIELKNNDTDWDTFLVTNENFASVACNPMDATNILFSSGTTASPKAIPWNHTTSIKVASDAYFHQNIKPGDILAWPTNLGWMMGPWLIYAALINHATIALYADAPRDKAFGEFIQNAKVTMLGVVPTLVATWRQSACMEGLDWSAIKVFSSTGECSNSDDMFYLMTLAGYKPVIEYCGGTEIGGAYLSSLVTEKNYPTLFSTQVMGSHFTIIDEEGRVADIGEVAIIPPTLGLSTTLLNADHYHVYYENMPKLANDIVLRRHGDQIKRYKNGYYSILGRVDDTMNLGGIKISAAEIERAVNGIEHIIETAAIAISPHAQGPLQLIIFAATQAELNKQIILKEMQSRINQHLNPLFKIHDVVFVKELPKTASNKIMRRMLRKLVEA